MTKPLLPTSIFNLAKNDYDTPRIILGQPDALLDTVNNHYPDLFSIYKRLRKLDWDELEFDFSSCLTDFETCDKSTYDMMFKTLIWQWEADSIAARKFISIIASFVTDSRVWGGENRISENECVTPDHEVLTPKGWKRIDQVTVMDTVAQWDYNTKAITWVKPTEVIQKHHKGVMYKFTDKKNNLSQVVTPNHRMPVLYPYASTKGTKEYLEAKDVYYNNGNAIPVSGFIRGPLDGMSAREKLFVAVQADGSISCDRYTGERTGTIPYKFAFKKQRKIDRLWQLTGEAGWEMVEYNTQRAEENGVRHFIVHVPVEQYNWDAKSFDWFDLDTIGHAWAEDFVRELGFWDGCFLRGNTRYINSDKACIDKAVAVGYLAGFLGHVTVIPARENVVMPTGKLSNTKENYQVYFTPRTYLTGKQIIKQEIPYDGLVYCISVPSTYFMVRHEGKISITGNCVHGYTYSEIVRNSFTNPNEIMDEVAKVTEAHERMKVVSWVLDEAHTAANEYNLGIRKNDQDLHDIAYLFFNAVYMFERIQFMASFAVTFAICKTGLFQPIGHAVKKIAQDEFEIHAQYRQGIIRHTLKTREGLKSYENTKAKVVELFIEVIKSEIEWIDYLFSEGRSLAGVNEKKLFDWVLFNANAVKVFLGITDEELADYATEYEAFTGEALVFPTVNPLPYMEEYMDISASQGSPQEEKSKSDYQVNLMDSRGEEEIFDF